MATVGERVAIATTSEALEPAWTVGKERGRGRGAGDNPSAGPRHIGRPAGERDNLADCVGAGRCLGDREVRVLWKESP